MKIKRKLRGKISGDVIFIMNEGQKLWWDNKMWDYEMKNGVLIVK